MNAVVVDNFNSILQSPFLAIVVTLAIVILSRVFWRRFFFKQQRLEIEALFVYPVKSCAGISVKSWPVGQYGFVDDRTWVVVDSTSGFQTQREYPRMALIQPSYKKNNTILCLNAPGMPELQIDRTKPPPGKRVQLGIWEDPRPANEESQECHDWFSKFLKKDTLKLFRAAKPPTTRPNDDSRSAFHDSNDLLFLTTKSLDGLRDHLPDNHKSCANVLRFRPNVLVSGAFVPHEEDLWKKVTIGGILFESTRWCTRCRLTTIDPEKGEYPKKGEQPLSTLRKYRTAVDNSMIPLFGMYLTKTAPKTAAALQVGDSIKLLKLRDGPDLRNKN